ncbi:hexose transporter, partial [Mycena rebaudengoi]
MVPFQPEPKARPLLKEVKCFCDTRNYHGRIAAYKTPATGMLSDTPQSDAVSKLVAQDDRPWYRKPNLRTLYALLLPACVGAEMTSAFDVTLMNGLQATRSWERFYHSPSATLLGVMTAMYSLGTIVSLPFVPVVVDRWGRRASIILGAAVMFFGAIVQGASQNYAMFVFARFLLGFGVAFNLVGGSTLIGELSHPKERAFMTSLFHGFFGIGSLMVSAITLATFKIHSDWAWRIPSFLQMTPSAMQLLFILFIPDSPRWLVAKGRGDEAYAILVKYHAEGNADSDFVKSEYAQIEKTLEMEREASRRGWAELFATPGMRKRSMIAVFLGISVSWSGGGLIWSYLPRILDGIGIHRNSVKNRINLALSFWGLFCASTLALIMPRFKRRTAFLACIIALVAVMIGWTIAAAECSRTNSRGSQILVLVFIFLYSPAFSLGFTALLYTYLLELMPFHVRAKGITLYQWSSRTLGFFNQLVNPIGMQNAAPFTLNFLFSYCIIVSLQGVFIFFMFPETSNRTLEELAF